MKKRIASILTAATVFMCGASICNQYLDENVTAASAVIGDVNDDGLINSGDMQLLNDYLLRKSETISLNADMTRDNRLDVFDLCLLRRMNVRTGKLVINEVCASSKKSYPDSLGNSPDWIELYNSSDKAISLTGYGLSDGKKNLYKYTFPSGMVIEPGGYFTIFCDSVIPSDTTDNYAEFGISASGENIYLTDPSGRTIDIISVPASQTDITFGRISDGSMTLASLNPTPMASNNGSKIGEPVDAPVFSKNGGFYSSVFQLNLSAENEIYYTLDGSDPRTSETAKLYDSSIRIYNNTSDANVYSAITDITLNEYKAPDYKVDKGIVVRAVCKNSDGDYSDVVTNSYFVGKTASYYTDFKVVSLSTDSDYLFDEDTGIYMVGSKYHELVQSGQFTPLADKNDTSNPTNYNNSGKEYEIPMNVQVFENGQPVYTNDVGARISGNWSRGYFQKSIRLYARSEYGDSSLKYEFIDGLTDKNGNPIDEFDKVTIRNGGTDNNLLHFKDIFIQQLCTDRAVDIQGGEPCMVFLEGEFWGFYFIREKQDADYVQSHYGIDKDNVTVLKNGELDDGSQTVADEYEELLEWAATADMTVPANYQKVCDNIDIQSLMDYIVIETYINNADWATEYMNNWIAWRATETDSSNAYADGKWRFMLYDLDFSADFFDDGRTFPGFDSLNSLYTGNIPYNFVPMFYNLLENEQFSESFYDTYIDIMKNNFAPADVSKKLDEYVSMYRKAIEDTNKRFYQEWVNYSYDDNLSQFREYFIARRNAAKRYLDKLYGIEHSYTEGTNIVGNVSQWSCYGGGTAEKSTADNSYTMTVYNKAQNSWDIQSQTPKFKLEKGKVYRLTFEASCTTSSPTAVYINHQVNSEWPSCFSDSNVPLTSQMQEFSYEFVASTDTASDWRLCFDYGNGAGVYKIKNVKIVEVFYETEYVNELGKWTLFKESGQGMLSVNSADNITVKTTEASDEAWQLQAFYSGMVFEKGQTYAYSFKIKSDTSTTANVHVQQNFGNYDSYSYETIDVGAAWKTYTFTFTANSSCMDASICFDCGNKAGTIEIADISLISQK